MAAPAQPAELKGTLSEAPLEELQKLAAEYEEVPVFFKQRNRKAQWVQLETTEFTIGDLMTDVPGMYLKENYGGGSYICEPRHPGERSLRLCKPWYITVIGPQKIAMTDAPRIPPAPSHTEMQMGYTRGFVPGAAGQVQQGLRPSDVMTYTSDQIAVEELRNVREENKKLKQQLDNKDRGSQQRIDSLQQSLQDMRLENAQNAARAREEALLGKIQQVEALITRNANQPPLKPAVDIVALLTGLAPVFIAFLATNKDRDAMQLAAQQRASDQQISTFTALMKRPDENPIKSLFEVAIPLLTTLGPKFMEAVSPSKLNDLLATQAENQMQMVALAAQAIRDLAPDPETPGMQFGRSLLEGILSITDQAQQRAAIQQHQQLQQQQQRMMQAPAPTVAVVQPPAGVVPPQPEQAPAPAQPQGRQVRSGPPRNARELGKAIVSDPLWPEPLRSAVWERILTTLHSYSRKPEDVGIEIAHTLEGLFDTQQLPQELVGIFEDDSTQPSVILSQLFAALPVAQDETQQVFYRRVLAAIDGEIVDESEAEPTVVTTPAPNGAADGVIESDNGIASEAPAV